MQHQIWIHCQESPLIVVWLLENSTAALLLPLGFQIIQQIIEIPWAALLLRLWCKSLAVS